MAKILTTLIKTFSVQTFWCTDHPNLDYGSFLIQKYSIVNKVRDVNIEVCKKCIEVCTYTNLYKMMHSSKCTYNVNVTVIIYKRLKHPNNLGVCTNKHIPDAQQWRRTSFVELLSELSAHKGQLQWVRVEWVTVSKSSISVMITNLSWKTGRQCTLWATGTEYKDMQADRQASNSNASIHSQYMHYRGTYTWWSIWQRMFRAGCWVSSRWNTSHDIGLHQFCTHYLTW